MGPGVQTVRPILLSLLRAKTERPELFFDLVLRGLVVPDRESEGIAAPSVICKVPPGILAWYFLEITLLRLHRVTEVLEQAILTQVVFPNC